MIETVNLSFPMHTSAPIIQEIVSIIRDLLLFILIHHHDLIIMHYRYFLLAMSTLQGIECMFS